MVTRLFFLLPANSTIYLSILFLQNRKYKNYSFKMPKKTLHKPKKSSTEKIDFTYTQLKEKGKLQNNICRRKLPENKLKLKHVSSNKNSPQATQKSKNQSKRINSKNIILRDRLSAEMKNHCCHKTKQSQKQSLVNINNCHSIRQYCVVDQSFIPLINSNEKRFISGLLANTVSTCDHWHSRLGKQDNLEQNTSQVYKPNTLQKNKVSKSINTQIILNIDQQINTNLVQCQEFGTQYTERLKQPLSEKRKQVQSLDQILLKLQFLHLPNEQSFKNLSKVERHHYSQLLESLIQKLAISPRKKVNLHSTSIVNHITSNPQQQKIKLYEELQLELFMRQNTQLSVLAPQNQLASTYTVMGIVEYIASFFCFIELNFADEFINAMNRVFGLSYKDKFLRISHNQSLEFPKKKVLPEQIFYDFLKQTLDLEQQQNSEAKQRQQQKCLFFRCIFDCINDQLNTYRAFYSSNGQPYPWSLKVIKSFTFFTIDEDAIEIIFTQIKQRIVEYVISLNGILVNSQQQKNSYNPVFRKQQQKQQKLIINWLKSIDEVPQFQNFTTKVMLDVSQQISEYILGQLCLEIMNKPE